MKTNNQIDFSDPKKEKQFRRLVIFHWDMEETKQFIKSLLQRFDEGPVTINRALVLGTIITYTRPFSANKGGKIPAGVTKQFNKIERKLHETIVGNDGLRNTLFAHSDFNAHQVDISIHEISGTKVVIPSYHDPYFSLSKDSFEVLLQMVTKIQARLSEMQISLQNKFTG